MELLLLQWKYEDGSKRKEKQFIKDMLAIVDGQKDTGFITGDKKQTEAIVHGQKSTLKMR